MQTIHLSAQGFDWQGSARLPYDTPLMFLGIKSDISINNHSGDFKFFEETDECCRFRDGNGRGYSISAIGEYWYTGAISLGAGIGFSTLPGKFSSQQQIPRSKDVIITSQFDMDAVINYITAETWIRSRLFESQASIGLSLSFLIKLDGNFNYSQSIISPADEYFNTNPPSQRRDINNGSLSGLSAVLINPKLSFSYDLDLGFGLYASPALSLGYQINSISSDDEWRSLSVSISISILKGF